MAKSVSTSRNRRFQTSIFSDSEIDVAIQLIHLSEDSDYHDELTASSTSCSDDKSLASASNSNSNSNADEMEDDGRNNGRRGTTTTLIEDIYEEIGDGVNRRRRKRRSRSVYEIYKLTKPVIFVK